MKRFLLSGGACLGAMMLGKGILRMADGGLPFPLAAALAAAGSAMLILIFTADYKQRRRTDPDETRPAARSRRTGSTGLPTEPGRRERDP